MHLLGGILLIAELYSGALHWLHNRDRANVELGKQQEAAHVLARTQALQKQLDGLSAKIRSTNNVQATRIITVEHDVLLRGPGKASCPASVPAVSSGPIAPVGTGNAPMDQVSSGGGQQLIALPFADTIRFAGQCDLNRNELNSDRTLYGPLGVQPHQPAVVGHQ